MAGLEFPKGEAMSGEAVPEAPTTRNSQIIEEEDTEDEAVEEVDTFSGQVVHANIEDSQVSPVEITNPAYDAMAENADQSTQSCKPALDPPPDLDTNPNRPPRSSSLRAPRDDAEGSGPTEPGDEGELYNASPKSTRSAK